MDINLLSNIGIASILAYLLGSIPFGQLVSRWRKVDIFRTGTQLSGASNVFQKTGHKLGVFVFFADAAKGAFAIIVAEHIGLSNTLLIFPGSFVILGHWGSIFARFRGGEGLSTLVGLMFYLSIPWGLPAITAGLGIALIGSRKRMSFPTLWAAIGTYIMLVALVFLNLLDTTKFYILVFLAIAVLLHAIRSHKKHTIDHKIKA